MKQKLLSIKALVLVLMMTVGFGHAFADDVTGTISFSSSTDDVQINSASVSGDDDQGNTWTITTAGTTYYSAQSTYCQIGSKNSPATSITFTTTLPAEQTITSFTAQFGGFSGTAATVTLKVDDDAVGSGSLSGTSDVTVENTSSASGTVLTVTVSGISRGVKAYSISYTYESGGSSSTAVATTTTIDATSITNTDIYTSTEAGSLAATVSVKDGDPIDGATVTWSGDNDDVATIDENGVVTLVGIGKVTFTASYAGVQDQYSSSSAKYTLTVVPVYASLDDLVADDNLTSGDIVNVTFSDIEIKDIFVYSNQRRGIYFDIQKDGNDIEIYYAGSQVPSEWIAGGTVSGTMQCPWKKFSNTWELAPESWSWDNLTYVAPVGVKTTATIEFTAKSKLEVNASDEYDVTYNGDGTLEVESSNTDVATVTIEDGHVVVTAVAVGTTTITVSAPETEDYTEASEEYTLTVTPAKQVFDRNVHKALVALKDGKYYAAYNTTSNAYFAVKEVTVYNNKVYSLSNEEAAAIAWKIDYDDTDATVATVQNLDNEYLTLPSSGTTVSLSSSAVELYAGEDGGFYYSSTGRGFGYNAQYTRMAGYSISANYPVAKAMAFAAEDEPLPANMRITSAGWGTFCAPFTVAIPDGVKAYWGENMISYIKLHEVEGCIPANTGVVVTKAVEGDPFEVYLSPNAIEYDGINSCFACNTAEEKMDVNPGDYLLQKNLNSETNEYVVGWYKIPDGGEGYKLAKYRCYLPGNANEGREFVGFEPVDDPTGISSIVSEIKTKADGKYMVKGQIIVVKSGKAYNLNGSEVK